MVRRDGLMLLILNEVIDVLDLRLLNLVDDEFELFPLLFFCLMLLFGLLYESKSLVFGFSMFELGKSFDLFRFISTEEGDGCAEWPESCWLLENEVRSRLFMLELKWLSSE
jgi:hypothetical protein